MNVQEPTTASIIADLQAARDASLIARFVAALQTECDDAFVVKAAGSDDEGFAVAHDAYMAERYSPSQGCTWSCIEAHAPGGIAFLEASEAGGCMPATW